MLASLGLRRPKSKPSSPVVECATPAPASSLSRISPQSQSLATSAASTECSLQSQVVVVLPETHKERDRQGAAAAEARQVVPSAPVVEEDTQDAPEASDGTSSRAGVPQNTIPGIPGTVLHEQPMRVTIHHWPLDSSEEQQQQQQQHQQQQQQQKYQPPKYQKPNFLQVPRVNPVTGKVVTKRKSSKTGRGSDSAAVTPSVSAAPAAAAPAPFAAAPAPVATALAPKSAPAAEAAPKVAAAAAVEPAEQVKDELMRDISSSIFNKLGRASKKGAAVVESMRSQLDQLRQHTRDAVDKELIPLRKDHDQLRDHIQNTIHEAIRALRKENNELREMCKATSAALSLQVVGLEEKHKQLLQTLQDDMDQKAAALRKELDGVREASRATAAVISAQMADLSAQAMETKLNMHELKRNTVPLESTGGMSSFSLPVGKERPQIADKRMTQTGPPKVASEVTNEGVSLVNSSEGTLALTSTLPKDGVKEGSTEKAIDLDKVWDTNGGSAWELFEDFRGRPRTLHIQPDGSHVEWNVKDLLVWVKALPRGHPLVSPSIKLTLAGCSTEGSFRLLFFPNGASGSCPTGGCSLHVAAPQGIQVPRFELVLGGEKRGPFDIIPSAAVDFGSLERSIVAEDGSPSVSIGVRFLPTAQIVVSEKRRPTPPLRPGTAGVSQFRVPLANAPQPGGMWLASNRLTC